MCEIWVVKFHYTADLFAWDGCRGDARSVKTAQSKF